mgnify:CR=1 FL=1
MKDYICYIKSPELDVPVGEELKKITEEEIPF